MKVNWKKIEQTAFDLATKAVSEFQKSHADETFYAFGIDCSPMYGNMMLSFNSIEGLRRTADDYAKRSGKPIDVEMEDLKWNTGDWEYHCFAESSDGEETDWQKRWPDVQDKIAEYFDGEEDDDKRDDAYEEFLKVACRVAIRLSKAGAFDKFKKTADFKLVCADCDEDPEDGAERLASVASEMS